MFNASIQDILTQRLQEVPHMVMAPSLRRDIDELLAVHISSGKIAIIDDARTSTAYGDHVFRALKDRYETAHIMLPLGVKADEAALAEIEAKSKRADLLIAVGSGTINDLVKLASHKAGKPYIVIPTAASMNGYVSRNASITIHGHKQSLSAQLPLAVLMDMELICTAPARLSKAGLGDALARSTAQADWLLSHHLLGTAYDTTPYEIIKEIEPAVFEQAKGVLHADKEVMEALMKLLLLSGFGMTIAGSSIPASGAEHMLAHAYEMSKSESLRENLHGEEIALTTLHCAALQSQLLDSPGVPRLQMLGGDRRIAQHFEETTVASFVALFEKKMLAIRARFPDGQIDAGAWERARAAMAAVHIPTEKIEHIITQAGLPESPAMLGWNEESYWQLGSIARYTRDRFTCLDVA